MEATLPFPLAGLNIKVRRKSKVLEREVGKQGKREHKIGKEEKEMGTTKEKKSIKR